MAAFEKINDFVADLANGVHNLGADQLELAFSNTAPASETSNPKSDGNGQLSNVTQIAYTYLSARTLTLDSSAQSGGTYTLSLDDHTTSCTGGTAATFQYIYVFNQAATADELICVFDYGSGLTLADGESLTVDFGSDGGTTGNLFTLA